MNNRISALIIDDERLARRELGYLLTSFPEIEVVGDAKNVTDALEKIQHFDPDLLFLDINLPGRTGLELLEELKITPRVIFVTAHDGYAVQAFEKNAFDYIMKPVKPERLTRAIEKVRKDIQKENGQYSELNKQIFLKDGGSCYFVKLVDIFLIESVGNYSKFYFDKRHCLINSSLVQTLEQLPSSDFIRANRRQIINLRHVADIKEINKGGLRIELINGIFVEFSIRNAVTFKEMKGV